MNISYLTGYVNPHTCKIPEGEVKEDWIPKITEPSGETAYSKCQMYVNRTIDNSTQVSITYMEIYCSQGRKARIRNRDRNIKGKAARVL